MASDRFASRPSDLTTLAFAGDSAHASDAPAGDLAALGRYRIERTLGEGAFGTVYAAHDPELDRKVAIKLLHTMRADSAAQARWIREAQALGSVSHPHVVSVFDVGQVAETDDRLRLYIAMELVSGRNLREWIDAGPKPIGAVVDVLRQIAEGLAAVHAASLVHRDLKPGNVLIGADGRARVADFGLARSGIDRIEPTETTGDGPPTESVALTDVAQPVLTATGALMGTPAYMAPEQFAGRPLTAASDQFAFGVVAFEVLFGQRPFTGRSLQELQANVLQGKRKPPPRGREVPAAIVAIVERCLRSDPSDRYPSMKAVADALALRWSTARWRSFGVLGVVAVALVAWVAVASRDGPGCERPEAALGWSDARSGALATAVRASGASYAETSLTRIEGRIERFAGSWTEAYGAACEREGGEARDRALACLRSLRGELDASAKVLMELDPSHAARAVATVAGLADPQRCLELAPGPRDRVDPQFEGERGRLRDELALAAALHRGGRYDAAARAAERVKTGAEAIGDMVMVAAAYARIGDVAAARRDFEAAQSALAQAHFVAETLHDDALAAEVAVQLGSILGGALNRYEDAAAWLRRGESHLLRAPASPRVQANLEEAKGRIAYAKDDYDAAYSHLEAAANMRAADSDDPEGAMDRMGLALILIGRGDFARAQSELEAVAVAVEAGYGADHPRLGLVLLNLGHARYQARDLDGAHAAYARSLAVYEAALGPMDPAVADGFNALANIEGARGRHEQALQRYRDALEIYGSFGERGVSDSAMIHGNIGLLLSEMKRYDEAALELGKALDLTHELMGDEQREAGELHGDLASVLRAAGRHAEALKHARRALTIVGKVLNPDHPELADAHRRVGETLIDMGREGEAIAELERAERTFAARPERTLSLAVTRFALARALWASGAHGRRARRLLVSAADLAAAEENGGALEAEIAAFGAVYGP